MKNIKQILDNLEKQDDKTVINMVDQSILADSYVQSIVRCGDRRPNATDHIEPEKVRYVQNQAKWNGITYFTYKTFNAVNQVSSPIKIAWVIEPKNLLPPIYEHVVALENEFDLIFTYEQELLERNPEKYKFQFCDAINIDRESINMHEKSKLVSMIASEKTWLFGHRLRHIIVKSLLPQMKDFEIDLFGNVVNKHIDMKSDSLNDYMFQIAIENAQRVNYFSEKIYDCFATGTVPIYWGAPNIGDFFDMDGVLVFNTPDELKGILKSLSVEKYQSMLPAIRANYEKCIKNHKNPDDVLYDNVIKYLLEQSR